MKKVDVYQIITDRIIALLERGTVPWRQPWTSPCQWPRNYISKKLYRGVNVFVLNSANYPSPFWLSFRQIQLLGGTVKKGEKSFPVVFWKILKDDSGPDVRRIPFLRYYNVFNIAQCEGIPVPAAQSPPVTQSFQPIEECERIVKEMLKPPVIRHGNSACYSPSLDTVFIPNPPRFESPAAYYHTLFHELAHATGHESRLNRKEIVAPGGFGSDPYSREELVAEMGSAFLCAFCGISTVTIDQTANYLQEWLKRLKDDRKLVVHAAAQAQRASDLVLNVKHAEDDARPEEQPKEFKVIALRECPAPEAMKLCDAPHKAAEYWAAHIATAAHFNSECECFVVLLLNVRKRVKGHHLVSIGTVDTILLSPTVVFRTAIVTAASSIVLMHNHPSGEPDPSEADIKATRDMIRAGQLLKIEVLDHVIMGKQRHLSLREHGCFNC